MDESLLLKVLDTSALAKQVQTDLEWAQKRYRLHNPQQREFTVRTEIIWVPADDTMVLPRLARAIITKALVNVAVKLAADGIECDSLDWRGTVHNVPGNGLVRELPWMVFSKKVKITRFFWSKPRTSANQDAVSQKISDPEPEAPKEQRQDVVERASSSSSSSVSKSSDNFSSPPYSPSPRSSPARQVQETRSTEENKSASQKEAKREERRPPVKAVADDNNEGRNLVMTNSGLIDRYKPDHRRRPRSPPRRSPSPRRRSPPRHRKRSRSRSPPRRPRSPPRHRHRSPPRRRSRSPPRRPRSPPRRRSRSPRGRTPIPAALAQVPAKKVERSPSPELPRRFREPKTPSPDRTPPRRSPSPQPVSKTASEEPAMILVMTETAPPAPTPPPPPAPLPKQNVQFFTEEDADDEALGIEPGDYELLISGH